VMMTIASYNNEKTMMMKITIRSSKLRGWWWQLLVNITKRPRQWAKSWNHPNYKGDDNNSYLQNKKTIRMNKIALSSRSKGWWQTWAKAKLQQREEHHNYQSLAWTTTMKRIPPLALTW
jgi:hypothetical protein